MLSSFPGFAYILNILMQSYTICKIFLSNSFCQFNFGIQRRNSYPSSWFWNDKSQNTQDFKVEFFHTASPMFTVEITGQMAAKCRELNRTVNSQGLQYTRAGSVQSLTCKYTDLTP